MKITDFVLLATFGLTLGASDSKSVRKVHGNTKVKFGQQAAKVSNEPEKKASHDSNQRAPEWVSKRILGFEGSTPQTGDPTRFNPTNNRPEYVASRPHSDAESYRMVDYSGLAYCPEGAIRRMSCKACRHVDGGYEILEVFTDNRFKGRAVLMVDKRYNQLVLSYRGSVFLDNWIQDFKLPMSPAPYTQGAQVHVGFMQIHQDFFPSILGPLSRALNNYPGWQLIVTGHSLGGALSTLMASEMLYRRLIHPSRLNVITFGEPRVGNVAFVRWYNSYPLRVTRVVNENDVIPHYVPASEGYVHHATEVYIHNNQSRICSNDQFEDPTCSLTRPPNLSIVSHNKAWDKLLGTFAC